MIIPRVFLFLTKGLLLISVCPITMLVDLSNIYKYKNNVHMFSICIFVEV